jgi:hypothetical protein
MDFLSTSFFQGQGHDNLCAMDRKKGTFFTKDRDMDNTHKDTVFGKYTLFTKRNNSNRTFQMTRKWSI